MNDSLANEKDSQCSMACIDKDYDERYGNHLRLKMINIAEIIMQNITKMTYVTYDMSPIICVALINFGIQYEHTV